MKKFNELYAEALAQLNEQQFAIQIGTEYFVKDDVDEDLVTTPDVKKAAIFSSKLDVQKTHAKIISDYMFDDDSEVNVVEI